ncbi:hypothetical protein ENUP19_0120G0017 [Entamoeba nuttalli]|uniref:Reverse transcriptase domain-containing protein n=1 Tax=Entamoeba nuttalli TaxID=412467 RepID=A0ABQ0DII7_9EUKA
MTTKQERKEMNHIKEIDYLDKKLEYKNMKNEIKFLHKKKNIVDKDDSLAERRDALNDELHQRENELSQLKTEYKQRKSERASLVHPETYYDISKSYDSINHQWIKHCLIYFNIPLVVINSILYILNNTYLNLYYNQENVCIINVERGIIQGDSLSPLLFVLSIDVLSKQLDKQINKLNIKMNGEENKSS